MSPARSMPVFYPRLREVRRRGRRGLGDQQSAQQGVQIGAVGASAATGAALAAGLIPASAVPIIGPAIAGVALLASLLIKNSGCGQTCIQTSSWANQAADALQKNLDAYFAQPVRYKSSQTLALQTYDQLWAQLVKLCSDPQWGNAGKRCISDRQRGACTWKQIYQPAYPGQPQLGQCFDWPSAYRDPIAQDAGVQPDPTPVSEVSSLLPGVLTAGGSSSSFPWLLVAGLVLLAVAS